MRAAKWMLVIVAIVMGALLTIAVVGFVWGLCTIAAGGIRAIARGIKESRSAPPSGEGPCAR